MNNSIWKYINYGFKVLLILGFVTVFLVENPALAGKGMEMRAPFFILGSFSIFIIAKLKKWKDYPLVLSVFRRVASPLWPFF